MKTRMGTEWHGTIYKQVAGVTDDSARGRGAFIGENEEGDGHGDADRHVDGEIDKR